MVMFVLGPEHGPKADGSGLVNEHSERKGPILSLLPEAKLTSLGDYTPNGYEKRGRLKRGRLNEA